MTGLAPHLNEPAQQLYRQTLRDKLRRQLNDPLITWQEKKRGLATLDARPPADKLEVYCRNVAALIALRREAVVPLSRREREALTPAQVRQLGRAA